MPLDRAHVTVASRIMLPAYPVLNLVAALTFWRDGDVYLAQVYDLAEKVAPFDQWAVAWALTAVLMIGAMVSGIRNLYIVALMANCGYWGVWAALGGVSAETVGGVTALACALPAFVAVACAATTCSLMAGETISRGAA